MKKLFLILILGFISITSFSQTLDTLELDQQYNFCLVIPERDTGYVTLKCSDGNGVTMVVKIRDDVFEGKINIIITPNEKPITIERTVNWFVLPEEE